EVRGVPPGPAQVRAIHSAYAPAAPATVEVNPARGPSDIRIVLSQGGRIEGRVRSREGALPAGAVVFARSMAPGVSSYSPSGPDLQPVSTDGTFVVEHVPAGPATVSLLTGKAGR